MMINKFSGILLDLDNTLYDYDVCHNFAINKTAKYFFQKLNIENELFFSLFKKCRERIHDELKFTAASHNRLLYFQRVLEHLLINPMPTALEAYNLYWASFLNKMEFSDGAFEFLQAFKSKGICLITDLDAHIQFRKIQKLKLFNYANFLVTSEEAGIEKPDKRIFKLALNKINKPISEVCMIGDNYDKDIKGALEFGIQSFWMNRTKQKKSRHPLVIEFSNFRELLPK